MSEHSGVTSDPTAAAQDWIIEPRGRNLGARVREVWQYRRLVRYFGVRAGQRLYQGTALGKFWLFLRSPLPVVLRAMVFGGILNVTAPAGLPYFLFLLVGSTIWELFAGCLNWATRSFQLNRSFLGKMYFPRVILPIATMAPAFLFFGIMVVVLGCAFVYYYVQDGQMYFAASQFQWSLAAILLAVTMAMGVGLFTSVLNAEYRDVRYTLRYVLEFWALLTPIVYPVTAIPEKWRWLVWINPMASVVQAFKWGLLAIEPVDPAVFLMHTAIAVGVLMCGLWYFGKAEGYAVDRI